MTSPEPSTQTLKPCPFCGNKNIHIIKNDDEFEGYYRVICRTCYIQTTKYGECEFCPDEKAVAAWNTRATPQAEPSTSEDMPDVIKFLLGEGTLYGFNYGERPAAQPNFWWRKHLREYFTDLLAQRATVRDEALLDRCRLTLLAVQKSDSYCTYDDCVNGARDAIESADDMVKELLADLFSLKTPQSSAVREK